ncbi:MAG: helix-turn-helix domain-containing protein [Quadrisphaera sp.]
MSDRGLTGRQPGAVQNALAVLEVVAHAGAGVTAKEVGELAQLPPATTYRLLNLLVGEEYLVRMPDLRGFALGRRAAALTGGAPELRLSRAARDELRRLRGSLRVGVHLVVFGPTALRFADVDPELPLRDPALLERHLHAGAAGRLLLADQPDWREVHPPSRLVRLTASTAVRPHQLQARLDETAERGWAAQTGEVHDDVSCLAAPVRGADGALVAAVVLSAPRPRPPVDHLDAARGCAAALEPLLA